MAKIVRWEWASAGPIGQLVRHVDFVNTLTINGKREREFSSAGTSQEEGLKALSERPQQIRTGQTNRALDVTLDATRGLA